MLTITVGTGKQYLYTQDDRLLLVRPVWASTSEGPLDFREIGGDFSDISIRTGGLRRKIRLTPRVKSGILRFLAEFQGKQQEEMDCYAFINLVYDRPEHHRIKLLDYWELRPLRLCLHTGQIIFLLRPKEKEFCHAAIYIGRGLFISVYGAGGDLEVAELADMLQGFQATEAFIACPKD